MKKTVRNLALFAIIATLTKTLLTLLFKRVNDAQPYIFDPDELQAIANLGAGLPIGKRWELIHQELRRRYPGKIAPELHWTFNSAGNVICQIAIVYGSPVEYVAFFGTPIGATGFSGRYGYADVWDLMVEGRMLTYVDGQFEPVVYEAGDPAYLKRGTSKGMAYAENTWMIDYGRGLPATMLPFGVVAPALFNTLDYESARKQLTDYGKLVLRGMFRS